MGCDIHAYAEKKNADGKYELVGMSNDFFAWRQYGLFAFLAGVRNYSAITPISEPRGIPDDLSEYVKSAYEDWGSDAHSASWLSSEELFKFDYQQLIEDRRCMRNNNGGSTCEEGEGIKQPLSEYLGKLYFDSIEELKAADRLVFWFDN